MLQWSPFIKQRNLPFAFEIYRRTNDSSYAFIKQVSSSVISFTDTGLAPKTKYFYVVRAIDSTGAAPLSDEVSISTYSDTTAPSIPFNLRSTYTTPSTISIAWATSTDNVGVDHYNIYLNNKLVNITKQTSFVLTSLNKYQPYTIYVKAVDGSNNISEKSNQITAEPILGGLKYSYYKTAVQWLQLPDFTILTPNKTGVSKNVDIKCCRQKCFKWIFMAGIYTHSCFGHVYF